MTDKQLEDIEKALRARLTALQSRARIADVLALARAGNAGLSTAGDAWDSEPMLLAVKNGVVDLTTGQRRDGNPSDMIRTACPVEWRGWDEPAPAWERFMSEIFNNNPELVAFMQRLLGYCITGQTNEEVYPILYGIGRNGKSKLVEAVKGILGDYSGTMSIETVMKQKADNAAGGARADLMALRSKRFVTASESDDGHRLNVGRIKSLSGGDRISARGPFERYQIDFEPTHKMILLTNFKPKIPPDDYAAWQRILLIPFSVKFVPEPKAPDERLRDEHIKEKLQAEYPGILAWLVRGCLKWQAEGLQPPEIVRAATENYRNENDSLADFIADCCQQCSDVQVKALFDAYQEYCQESGIDALRINEFSEHMHRKYDGYSKQRKKFLIGISLLSG